MGEVWVEPRWENGELLDGYFTLVEEPKEQMPTPEEQAKIDADKAKADADAKAKADADKAKADAEKDGDKGDKKEYTPEYVARLRNEAAAERKKAEEASAKLREIEDAELKRKGESEKLAEKAIKERDDAIADAKLARDEARQTLIAAEAKAYAASKGAHDVNDVLRMIELKDAKVGDDGTVTGVREAIDKLIESKAYLFKADDGDKGKKRPEGWKGSPDEGGKNEPKDAFKMSKEEFSKEMMDKFKVRV